MLSDYLKSESKPPNILEIGEMKFTSTEDYHSFYDRFRGAVCRHLKKSGSRIKSQSSGDILLQDEIISPTFEEVIILWCLEKIDYRLPGLTNQVFGHKINNETTLKDIQDEVFDNIPLLLDKYGVEIKYDDENLLELAVSNAADGIKNEKDILKEETAVQIKSENNIANVDSDKSGYNEDGKTDPAVSEEEDDIEMKDTEVYSPGASDTIEVNKEVKSRKSVEKPFQCQDCIKSFVSNKGLIEHARKFHANSMHLKDLAPKRLGIAKDMTKHICDICGKSFRLKHMKRHKKTHVVDNLYCDECDLSFQDRKTYIVHTRSHRPQTKKAFCDQCGQTFTQESTLKSHMKIHLQDKVKCLTCKRTFFDKTEMGSHVCKHYACDVCGEKFLRARNVEIHKKVHIGEDVFSCDQCESLFLIKKKLTKHIRDQHKTEKKYKCDLCEKRFLLKSGLTSHMLTHTGEKPFKCDDCGLRFTQKGNLDTHRKLHTTDEMAHQCTGCKAKFRQAGELKRHRESKKCGFSHKDFYSSSLVNINKDVFMSSS